MLSSRPWTPEGLVRLGLGIAFFFCVAVVLQALAQHVLGKARFIEGSLVYEIFVSLTVHGSILAGTAFFIWSQHKSWNDFFGFNQPPLGRAIIYAVVAIIIFLPIGFLLQTAASWIIEHYFHTKPPAEAAVEEFSKTVSWQSRAYLVFFAVAIAPVAEEILFRGIIYGTLRQVGFPRVALWTSALIFAACHEQQLDKNHLTIAAIFVPLVLLGLLFAWLYEKTDNLLSSITAHSLFNASNLALMFYGNHLESVARWLHIQQ